MQLAKYTKRALRTALRSQPVKEALSSDKIARTFRGGVFRGYHAGFGISEASTLPRLSVFGQRGFHSTQFAGGEGDKEADETGETDEGEDGEAAGDDEEGASVEDELRAQLAELQKAEKEMKDSYVRSLAEIENVRTIAKLDVENATTYAATKFAKSMLEVADNLGRALDAVPSDQLEENDELKTFHEGVLMTEDGLQKAFSSHGITKFGEVGEAFDPALHSALFQFENPDMEPNTIGQVMLHGYTFKDRVLRPANVGTVKKD